MVNMYDIMCVSVCLQTMVIISVSSASQMKR
jgi:hypothetical protein